MTDYEEPFSRTLPRHYWKADFLSLLKLFRKRLLVAVWNHIIMVKWWLSLSEFSRSLCCLDPEPRTDFFISWTTILKCIIKFIQGEYDFITIFDLIDTLIRLWDLYLLINNVAQKCILLSYFYFSDTILNFTLLFQGTKVLT